MKGREQELPEETHRHPSAWWEERYKWINEEGEPEKPDYKSCGRNVRGLEYMRDEWPEQAPGEETRLNCLRGNEFLMTQREKIEAARLRAITNVNGRKGRKRK